MTVSTGVLPPVDLHTEADISRLCESLRQFLPQLPESSQARVKGAQLPPFRDLAAESSDDDVAVALRVQNAMRHALYRPLMLRASL